MCPSNDGRSKVLRQFKEDVPWRYKSLRIDMRLPSSVCWMKVIGMAMSWVSVTHGVTALSSAILIKTPLPH